MTNARHGPATHRAPSNWRATLRRGRRLVEEGEPEGLEVLFRALRWRYDTARSEAVRAIASLRRPPVPRLRSMVRNAETAVMRRAAMARAATKAVRRIGLQSPPR